MIDFIEWFFTNFWNRINSDLSTGIETEDTQYSGIHTPPKDPNSFISIKPPSISR